MKRTWTIIGVGDVPGSFKWLWSAKTPSDESKSLKNLPFEHIRFARRTTGIGACRG
jgi:hypothetical protein